MKAYTDYLSLLNGMIAEEKVTRAALRTYDMSILKKLGVGLLWMVGLMLFGTYGMIAALVVAGLEVLALVHAYKVRKVLVNNLEDAA